MKKYKILFISSSRADFGLINNVFQKFKKEYFSRLLITGSHLDGKLNYKKEVYDYYKQKQVLEINVNEINNLDTNNPINISKYTDTFYNFFKKNDFNTICILGDRYEMLGICLAAFHLNKFIIHIGGGDITEGSYDNTYRYMISKMSDLHYVTSIESKKNLINHVDNKKKIKVVGNLALENILNLEKSLNKIYLQKKYKINFDKFLVIINIHSEKCILKKNLFNYMVIMKLVQNLSSINFIITSSNLDQAGREMNKLSKFYEKKLSNLLFINNFGHNDYLATLKNCDLILGNSSSGIFEAPFLDKFSINLGNRQKGRERNINIIDLPFSYKNIYKTILKIKDGNIKVKKIFKKNLIPASSKIFNHFRNTKL